MLPKSNKPLTSGLHARELAGEIPPSASPSIASGLPKLRGILSAEKVQVSSYDELYSVAISVLRLVVAKEMRQMNSKFNMEEKL